MITSKPLCSECVCVRVCVCVCMHACAHMCVLEQGREIKRASLVSQMVKNPPTM